jgi:hypothetical protein
MNEFKTVATHKTPEINGNIETGELSIKGKCIPEDARDFFVPFRNWLLDFVKTPQENIKVEVDLEYFNTSTSSIILDVFKHLNRVNSEKNVQITWIFEEDDIEMEEVGEDYKIMIGDIITLQSKEVGNFE